MSELAKVLRAMACLCCPRCGWMPGEPLPVKARGSCDECAPARAAWVTYSGYALGDDE